MIYVIKITGVKLCGFTIEKRRKLIAHAQHLAD